MTEWRPIMRALILSATALVSIVAAPAFADHNRGYGAPQAYGSVDPGCEGERRTSRNVGGFLGALGGASAGRALAAAAVRPEGVILGTVVGAIIGSSVGSAAVDCTPRPLYTQDNGRSYGATHTNYGQAQGYQQAPQVRYYNYGQSYDQAPVYQQPVYQPPVYQQPVYQPPVYQQPVYQQPVYQQPAYQEPVHQVQQVVAGEDWYQPSSQSYYGQERRGPLASAPPAYGRPDYVPSDSYVVQQQQSQVVVTQTYQAGGPVYAPQYAPYQGGPVIVAPQGAPCGYQMCR
jgi:hypothetical protein